MNIPRHLTKIFLGVILLLGGYNSAYAQPSQNAYAEYETVKNESVSFTYFNYTSWPNSHGIEEAPVHGTAVLYGPGDNGGSNYGEWSVYYTPNQDFVGTDEMLVKYKSEGWGAPYIYLQVRINVLPAYIKALDDFATTSEGQTVEIDVLANDDWTGSDAPHVEGVTLVNSGTGQCADSSCGSVTFTPEPGFTGIAHLNYTICDDDNNCDDAIVNISVIADNPAISDSLFIITSRDVNKVVLFDLAGYSLSGAFTPSYGTVGTDNVQGVPTYIPNAGFAGFDEFRYHKFENNIFRTRYVRVHVLDTPAANDYLLNDHGYTTENATVTIDVGANDLITPGSYITYQQPAHGVATPVSIDGVIQYQYTPEPFFTGIDVFKYRGNVGAGTETATVYVHVNNQVPSQPVFELNSVKNIPLVIDYGIPVSTYSFSLVGTGAENGTVEVVPGYSTQTWNGQTTSGYNLIVYTPNNNYTGSDEFEVEYSVTGNPDILATVKIVIDVLDIEPAAEQQCIGDNCVWPGDTNHDGVVNMRDVLPIGLCMGETGEGRYAETIGADWYGQYGDNWNDPFEQPGFDLKHIDTDGDSIISNADTAAIRLNYGAIHNLIPVAEEPIPLPIYLKYSGGNPQPGDMVSFEVYLGDSLDYTDYALDIHGITSTLNYDPSFVEPGSMNITFPTDTWMSYDAPTLGMSQDFYENGKIDFAFTRTNGVSIDGYGLIAQVDFVIIEDLIDGRPGEEAYFTLPFSLSGTGIMNGAGGTYGLQDTETTMPLHIPGADEKTIVTNDDLRVFPNPTGNVVNLYLNGGSEVESYEIFNVAGQLLTSGQPQAKSATIDVSAWNGGTYVVRAVTVSGEVLNSKFSVAK